MKLNRYQRNMMRSQKRTAALSGKGIFVFRNNTSGDLMLPRATHSGLTRVGVNEEFQGDDYYMFMVQAGELRLVKVIDSGAVPTQPVLNESVTMGDQLITEQPPTVTNEGTVEYHVQQDQKPLNENQPKKENQRSMPDVLLNENPLDGVEII